MGDIVHYVGDIVLDKGDIMRCSVVGLSEAAGCCIRHNVFCRHIVLGKSDILYSARILFMGKGTYCIVPGYCIR